MTGRITIEKVMAVTGTGPQVTRRLIREGKLPGYMEGRHYICTPGEFDLWYAGKWQAKPKPVEITPIHRRKTA